MHPREKHALHAATSKGLPAEAHPRWSPESSVASRLLKTRCQHLAATRRRLRTGSKRAVSAKELIRQRRYGRDRSQNL